MRPLERSAVPPRLRDRQRRWPRRRARRLALERLEARCLLALDDALPVALAAPDPASAGPVVYVGLAPAPLDRHDQQASPTNPGLLLLADVATGATDPWWAPFASPQSAERLAADEGLSGLAFTSDGRLFAAASAPAGGASELLELDARSGRIVARTPVLAGARPIEIDDLAWRAADRQLYGVRALSDTGPVQLYVLDPDTGQAVPVETPASVAAWHRADGLAFGPDGALYVAGLDRDGRPRLYTGGGVVPLAAQLVGLASLPTVASDGFQLVGWAAGDSQPVWIRPTDGQPKTLTLQPPTHGVGGDLDFPRQAGPLPQTLFAAHFDNPDDLTDGFQADNSGGTLPGMWHTSVGREADGLENHTPPGNWYYGQYETSTRGGNYMLYADHRGSLRSPTITIPECGITRLSFSYVLNTRSQLDRDFVEVAAEYVDEFNRPRVERLLSRAEDTLPQTGDRWLTATADLTPLAGRDVRLRFSFNTGRAVVVDPEGWFLDDVLVASLPAAVCGYKWHDQDADGAWDANEPGLSGWTIYAERQGDPLANGRLDAATAEQHIHSTLDANDYVPGRTILDPDGNSTLSVQGTGTPVWAEPDAALTGGQVFAWSNAPSAVDWQESTQPGSGHVLRVAFVQPVQTVALDFAGTGSVAGDIGRLRAYDAADNLLAEVERDVGTPWQTFTITRTQSDVAYVLATGAQTLLFTGPVRLNNLRAWGTQLASPGEPSAVTDSRGQYQFPELPPGTYTIREVPQDGQTYPGAPLFGHVVTVAAGPPIVGRFGIAEAPNFGNGSIPPAPSLTITKTASVPGGTADVAGEVISYTVTVKNTGNVSLTHVLVSDPLVANLALSSGDTDGDGVLDVGETWVYAGTYTATQADLDTNGGGDGLINNTATVDTDQTPPTSGSTSVPVAPPSAVTVTKTASVPGGTADVAGEVISYTVTVKNTGNVSLTHVVVSDPLVSNLALSSGDTDGDGVLDVGETWVYAGTYTVTQADLDTNGGGDGLINNTATVDTDQTPPTSGSTSVPVAPPSAVTVTKTASVPGGTADVAGEVISYTVAVKNTGNVSLTHVVVSDPLVPNLALSSGDTDGDGVLDVGETWVYAGTYTVTQADLDTNGGGDGLINNTATVDTDQTPPTSGSTSVPVAPPSAVTVTKTASVPGGTADVTGEVIRYTVTVKNTGNVSLTHVVVSDPLVANLALSSGDTDGDGVLDVGETWVYAGTYTVTQADLDTNGGGDGLINNTATVDTDQTPPTSGSTSVPVAPPVRIVGLKFDDQNGDGVQDRGELGLPGWEIRAYVDGNGDGTLQQAEYNAGAADTGVTNSSGEYHLELLPGAYLVVEVLQAGWEQTEPSASVLDPALTPVSERLGRSGFVLTVVAGQDIDGAWWVANSNGTSFASQNWGDWSPPAAWLDVQTADVTGDGKADVVGRTASGQWRVGRSTGTSLVNESWGSWAPGAWLDVQVVDVTGDGRADVVGRTTGGQWWVGRSDGTQFISQAWGQWPSEVWLDVQVADVTGDGRADVVGRTAGGQWWVGRSDGTQFTSQAWGSWSPETWLDVQVADVTGDGRADVVGRTASGSWWVGRSDGTQFISEFWGYWSPLGWLDVAAGDVDGDGRNDVVGRAPSGDWWVARSDGTKFTNQLWGYWSPLAWRDVQLADLDGDGRSDVVGRTDNGQWWVGRSNGSGFVNAYWGSWLTGFTWQNVVAADMTGDQRADLVGRSSLDFGNQGRADLEIVGKTDSPDPVLPGSDLAYTINFTNHGPTEARRVTVRDALSASTTFASAAVIAGGGWTIAAPSVGETGVVVFTKGLVVDDESATFQIVVHVPTSTPGGIVIPNTVTADSPTHDPTPANDQQTALTATTQVVQFITPLSVYRSAQVGAADVSPFVRPADDELGHIRTNVTGQRDALLTALHPWQTLHITNTTGASFNIVAIAPQIASPGDSLVTILDANLNPVALPIPVAANQTVEFWAFYDPAIRNPAGDTVLQQYPDWDGSSEPPHTFQVDDHLKVQTDVALTFRVNLVGGSSYDSDIFYDGAVDELDRLQLGDLLIDEWPIVQGTSALFDPTSDINARCPNGAGGSVNTCSWPLAGPPSRELGLGDFGPQNVEWNRARAPFLDLDPDNSSGARGVDSVAQTSGAPVAIADTDAAFGNSVTRLLSRITLTITKGASGDQLNATATGAITVQGNGTHDLVLSGDATVEDYTLALRNVTYSNSSSSGPARTVEIQVIAYGKASVAPSDSRFTSYTGASEVQGNTATARIFLSPAVATSAVPAAPLAASGEAYVTMGQVADAACSPPWRNPLNPQDVNGDGKVTSRDVLSIINYINSHPGQPSLPATVATSPPFYDVNGDGLCTPLDVLLVVGLLNSSEA